MFLFGGGRNVSPTRNWARGRYDFFISFETRLTCTRKRNAIVPKAGIFVKTKSERIVRNRSDARGAQKKTLRFFELDVTLRTTGPIEFRLYSLLLLLSRR